MLKQARRSTHDTIRHVTSRLARHVVLVVLWGNKWNLGLRCHSHKNSQTEMHVFVALKRVKSVSLRWKAAHVAVAFANPSASRRLFDQSCGPLPCTRYQSSLHRSLRNCPERDADLPGSPQTPLPYETAHTHTHTHTRAHTHTTHQAMEPNPTPGKVTMTTERSKKWCNKHCLVWISLDTYDTRLYLVECLLLHAV